MSETGGGKVQQATIEQIVTIIAGAIDAEPVVSKKILKVPDGPEVGRQMQVDATEKDGPLNTCRLAILNVNLAPAGEVARIEYEHERQGKYGLHKVYSIQSIRRQAGQLVLLENFIADSPQTVREPDFRPIASEDYAQTVLKSITDWTRFRAWQLQQARLERDKRS